MGDNLTNYSILSLLLQKLFLYYTLVLCLHVCRQLRATTWGWKLSLGPLEEQPVLLTGKPDLPGPFPKT